MNPEHVVERDGRKFVKYGGLLDEAHEQGLKSITTSLIQVPGPDNERVAIVIASVTTEKGTFTGIGDANPRNVQPFLAEAIIRMAETRAKARALRDAVNVDMTSLEELGEEIEAEHHESQLASAKQVAYIVSLAEQAGINEERFIARYGRTPDELDRDMASMIIEELKASPAAARAPEPTPIRPATAATVTPAATISPDAATVAQLRAIYSINRKLGLSEPQTDEECKTRFNCLPNGLTKRQASDWIQRLQEEVK